MKNLIQVTTAVFLLVQTISYGQTKTTDTIPNTPDTIEKSETPQTEIDPEEFKSFIGTYFLAEGNFTLEIIEEDNKMYIVSPFSKDLLIAKNETTLHEATRGVDLELIKDNPNALVFTQNGYLTTIKRVTTETKN